MPDDNPLSPAAQRVQQALRERGFTNAIIEHAQTTRTARDAAAAVGCSVAQIAKSLIFRGTQSGLAVLVIASGPNRVDEARLGERIGEPIQRADPDFVQAVTGFAIGGVPPLGHKSPLLTFIDRDFFAHDVIWAAGGTPNAVFALTPAELQRMTGGEVISV